MAEVDLVEAVTTRLKAEVPALQGRVEGAAELAALVEKKQLPQRAPAAFVLPLGDTGEANVQGHGAHRQRIIETVGVLLVERHAGDAKGERQRAKLVPLRRAARDAVASWQPDPDYRAFDFVRGRLVSMVGGAVLYQLDFRTSWHRQVAN